MRIARLILFLIFVLFASAALAAKPENTLVCHVGNELGSNGESYLDNADCDILPPYGGDPADYICPDAGKIDLISAPPNAKHIGNAAHSFLDAESYLWEDYAPEDGVGDDPADFEEGDVVGIDRGCELATLPNCYDGVQNGDEQGVDCGPVCGIQCPDPNASCNDGIQNGFEEGVDCGGICGTECPII